MAYERPQPKHRNSWPAETQETTVVGPGNNFSITEWETFQACLTGESGALAATVVFEVSLDGVHFVPMEWVDLSVTNWLSSADDTTKGVFSRELKSWTYVRSNVTVLSGDGAMVTTIMY